MIHFKSITKKKNQPHEKNQISEGGEKEGSRF